MSIDNRYFIKTKINKPEKHMYYTGGFSPSAYQEWKKEYYTNDYIPNKCYTRIKTTKNRYGNWSLEWSDSTTISGETNAKRQLTRLKNIMKNFEISNIELELVKIDFSIGDTIKKVTT